MVYCFLADGFEEMEAVTPVDLLRRAGLDVKFVSVMKETVTSSHGLKVTADLMIDDIKGFDDIDAIILPGGMPGTLNLQKSSTLQRIISYCDLNKKYICAICAAPLILGELGLLQGRNATCYPGFEERLFGATVHKDKVVVDGHFITSKGAGTAVFFGLTIVEKLLSKDKADEIFSSIQC